MARNIRTLPGLKARPTSIIIILLQAVLSAQQQPPPATFRATARLVIQNVSVKDKNGKPIEGLTAKDFIVTEDNVPQTISFAEYERMNLAVAPPITALTIEPASPETRTPLPLTNTVASPVNTGLNINVPADSKFRGRRLLVFYFDTMQFFDGMRAFENAQKYLATRMTEADLVAVMTYNGRGARLIQDFTDDRAALIKVLAQLAQDAQDRQDGTFIEFDFGGPFGENDATFNVFAMDRQLAALQTAVMDLGRIPEVKTMMYFGTGRAMNGTENLAQLRATVNAAVRAGVTINPIDARGLTASAPMGNASQASPGGAGMFNGAIAQNQISREMRSQDTFYAIAKDTGGKAIFNNNDLAMGMSQVADVVTGYYMIGYYSTQNLADGKYRRVKISLANGLAGELEFRPGYYADKPYTKFNDTDKERQLADALKLEDPITEIPMAMEVNYFQLSKAEYYVPVSLRMPGGELTRPRPKGTTKVEIDVIGEIKDEYAVTRRNMRDKIEIDLNADTAARVASRPIQYESGFTLLPGSYVIKLLARDTVTGRIGTFQQSFVIPNVEREDTRLAISSVVLTSQLARPTESIYTVKQKIAAETANPLMFEGLKLVPSVTRAFSVSRPLYVFLQAYERNAPPPASADQPASRDATVPSAQRPVAAFVTFYRDGVKVFETDPLLITDGWEPRIAAVPIRFTLSLGQLPLGQYDCQVTVLDSDGGRAAFWRAGVTLIK